MNYQLLKEDKCPYCEQDLIWDDWLWESRQLYEEDVEAYCEPCNITYQHEGNQYFCIRRLDDTHAVEEEICLIKNFITHQTLLIPSKPYKKWAYWLPDESTWTRTERTQKALISLDNTYFQESQREYNLYLKQNNYD